MGKVHAIIDWSEKSTYIDKVNNENWILNLKSRTNKVFQPINNLEKDDIEVVKNRYFCLI